MRSFKVHFTLYRKIVRNYKDFGFKIATRKILNRLIRPFYVQNELTLYELDINAPIPGPNSDIDINYIIVDDFDHKIISQMIEMEEWLEGNIKRKFSNGAICSIALHGNDVIGFILTTKEYGEMPTLKLKIKIDNDSVWGDQISVKKAYRRFGISNGLRRCLYPELKKRGISRLFGHRASYNIASKMSSRRVTKRLLADVRYQKILGMHRIFVYKLKEPKAPNGCAKSKSVLTNKDNHGYFILDIDSLTT